MNMRIYTLILCLLANQSVITTTQQEPTNQSNSIFTNLLIGGVIVTGAVLAAPLVLPAGTMATLGSAAVGTATAIKTGAGVIVAKAAAAGTVVKTTAVTVGTAAAIVSPVISTVGNTVTVMSMASEVIFPGEERQLMLLQHEVDNKKNFNERLLERRDYLAKEQAFKDCLSKNINLTKNKEYDVPYPCAAVAQAFAQVAGFQEMQRIKNTIYT